MLPQQLVDDLRYIEIYTIKATRQPQVADYRSPMRGRGFDLDQHKLYQHGDDYRQIDWNVTARLGVPYVRRDFEEREMSAILMADLSRSMEFATVDRPKRELLVEVAATLAFCAATDNMKVGLLGFTDRIEVELPARKGLRQVWRIADALWHATPASPRTDFFKAFDYANGRLKQPGLLFCISDFISGQELFGSHALKRLARRHDLIPVIVEDPMEEVFPAARGFMRVRDAESGGEMLLRLSEANRRVLGRFLRERKVELRRWLYRLQLDHLFLRTGEPFLEPIISFFLARKRAR